MLAPNRRGQKNEHVKMIAVYGIIYFSFAGYCYVKGNMLVDLGNRIDINGFMSFYIFAGLVCATLVIIETLCNRKNIANKVFVEIIVFTPFDAIVLLLQFFFRNSIFMSTTYVAPFLLFYILFHSNPFNELTGCQNVYAYESMLNLYLKRKNNFVLIQFDFPQLSKFYSDAIRRNLAMKIAAIVKDIEKFDSRIRIYQIDAEKFVILRKFNKLDDHKVQKLYKKMISVLEKATSIGTNVTYGSLIGFTNFWYLKNEADIQNYLDFLENKLQNSKESRYLFSTEITQNDFVEEREISFALENIVFQNDLDDPRVLCFAQPIYNIETDSFKTAEALMRLRIDGKLIQPYKFISVAEHFGYIHALTCIMLNKVCRSIKNMSEKFEFETITINCSPNELSDTQMYMDFVKIIESYDIDKSKINFEITENAMFDNYDVVKYNMSKLEEIGVRFYLDDFGTGYSNIERITSCKFKTIKFDKTLLYKALDNDITDNLVSSMIDMIKSVGMNTLVEGVENEEQYEYCKKRGFDYIQGFKYAKPQPISNLENYFAEK